jgi:LPS sulfotransferase NodH
MLISPEPEKSLMNSRSKFVIIGTQRTGTTYIRTMLDNHPDVRCIGEAFLQTKQGSEYFHNFKKNYHNGFFKNTFNQNKIIKHYFDVIFDQDQYKAIGFKLMLNQSKNPIKRYIEKNDLKIMIVTRENILKTYISRETAKKSNIFHLKDYKKKVEKIHLDADQLIGKLKKIEKENENLLCYTRKDFLHITYEAVLMSAGNEFKRMLRYIGVDEEFILSSPLKKINPNTLPEIVANFSEVERLLMNTRYERYLA